MLNNKIKTHISLIKNEKDNMQEKYEKNQEIIKQNLKTPIEDIEEYNKLIKESDNMKANKRKNTLRKADNMKNMHKNFDKDNELYLNSIYNFNVIRNLENEYIELTNMIKTVTEKTCDLLNKNKFVEIINNESFILTEKGKIASMIAEINNLVFSEILIKKNKFEGFTGDEIICSLSFMIDIKTSDDVKSNKVNCKNYNVSELVTIIDKELQNYNILETNFKIISGIDYDTKNYDLPDIIEGWLECKNEHECKDYITNIINIKYEIMTGEFIKCLLKICAIVKEINKMSEELGYIKLLDKMQNIEEKVLKYVVTPQSLYL